MHVSECIHLCTLTFNQEHEHTPSIIPIHPHTSTILSPAYLKPFTRGLSEHLFGLLKAPQSSHCRLVDGYGCVECSKYGVAYEVDDTSSKLLNALLFIMGK